MYTVNDTPMHSEISQTLWWTFGIIVFATLVIDLFVLGRNPTMTFKKALFWVCIWITLGLGFNGYVFAKLGSAKGLEFFSGYLVELALSVDNLFVFILIFKFFQVPAAYHHRVIFWGVLGAMLMRALFVYLGSVLIAQFAWVVVIFGLFLVFTGFKSLFDDGGDAIDLAKNPAIKTLKRILPMTPDYRGQAFFSKEGGRWLATPLLLVVIVVEISDVIFAIDSVPAVFGITQDPFIVYASNIFAILGLRSLYFVLAGAMVSLPYLKQGVALILIFVGAKMVIEHFLHVPIGVSLSVILSILATSAVASIAQNKRERQDAMAKLES